MKRLRCEPVGDGEAQVAPARGGPAGGERRHARVVAQRRVERPEPERAPRPRPASRAAACSVSPSAITYSGSGSRATTRRQRVIAPRRSPVAAASRARPAAAGAYAGMAASAAAYACRAAPRFPRAISSPPSRLCTYATFSGTGPPAVTARRIAPTAPSRSPVSSRKYDTRAYAVRFGLRSTSRWSVRSAAR